MTPIDWKRELNATRAKSFKPGHHSLMTPIDWKLTLAVQFCFSDHTVSPLADDTY